MTILIPLNALKVNKGIKIHENYFSVLNKVKEFIYFDNCPEEFLYCYDDVLLAKKITNVDIFNTYQFKSNDKEIKKNSSSRWGVTVNNSYSLVGDDPYNFEHHLPLIYKRDKLKELFEKFDFTKKDIPYALATTYFNYFKEEQSYTNMGEYKAGFEGFGLARWTYQQNTVKQISDAVLGKTWVNYNDVGLFWIPKKYPLQEWIIKTFNKKLKYEVESGS
ncbi:hypothetical protein JW865_09445 [Candidatus Bathyarchaeota archaeon]|nr:hypothetical protein [Candidatus Bathyarchaeota archaeon]